MQSPDPARTSPEPLNDGLRRRISQFLSKRSRSRLGFDLIRRCLGSTLRINCITLSTTRSSSSSRTTKNGARVTPCASAKRAPSPSDGSAMDSSEGRSGSLSDSRGPGGSAPRHLGQAPRCSEFSHHDDLHRSSRVQFVFPFPLLSGEGAKMQAQPCSTPRPSLSFPWSLASLWTSRKPATMGRKDAE